MWYLSSNFSSVFSISPSLSLSSSLYFSLFGFLSFSLGSHLTCQCVNVTLHQGNIPKTIWRMREKASNLFISHQQKQPVFEVHSHAHTCINILIKCIKRHVHRHTNTLTKSDTHTYSFIAKNHLLVSGENKRQCGTCRQSGEGDSSETCGLISYFQEETYLIIYKLTS